MIYLTQVKPSFAFLTITPSSANLYLTSLDEKPEITGVTIKKLKQGWEKALQKKVKKVGLNYGAITIEYFKKAKKMFPKAKFVDISKKLIELREIKTKEEIKSITKACKITDFAFNELLERLEKKKLFTEKEVALFLEKKIQEKGGGLAFPTIAAIGKNAAIPHYNTGHQKIKRGFLLLDFGASYNNYCSDMSRTIFLGTINKEERERYELLLNSQESAINKAKLGMRFNELDKEARKCLGKYSSYFIHSLGHGVGVDIHEKPSFALESNQEIKANQIFTIEPGIYFPNKFGLRIEDTTIFNHKIRPLTKSTKELIKIKI